MKMQKSKTRWIGVTAVLVLGLTVCMQTLFAQIPVGTAFTYHGRFPDPNVVPDGRYDLLLELYDDSNGGNLVVDPIELTDVDVVDGCFMVDLDLGSDASDGENFWLSIGVRCSGSADDYVFIGPRQVLSADPTDSVDVAAYSIKLPCVSYANYSGAGFYVRNEYRYSGNSSGGSFTSDGSDGRGVWGTATGIDGIGVRGNASNTGQTQNFGGYFTSHGDYGIGALGVCYGWNGYGVLGRCDGSSGIGVIAYGRQCDFYAAGAGANYCGASSIRWKTNVQPIDEPLEKVMELRGVYYDWDDEHGGQHDVGMIAEEVGKVLPEIVTYEENGVDAKGMDYSKLTPLLMEAVKALKTELDELKDQSSEKSLVVERLTDQISELRQLQRDNEELRDRLSALESAVTNMSQLPSLER